MLDKASAGGKIEHSTRSSISSAVSERKFGRGSGEGENSREILRIVLVSDSAFSTLTGNSESTAY